MKTTKNNLSPELLSIVNTFVGATTYHVDSINGNDSNDGLTAGTAFRTISAAINKVSNATILAPILNIRITPGTYNERINMYYTRGTRIEFVNTNPSAGKVIVNNGMLIQGSPLLAFDGFEFILDNTSLTATVEVYDTDVVFRNSAIKGSGNGVCLAIYRSKLQYLNSSMRDASTGIVAVATSIDLSSSTFTNVSYHSVAGGSILSNYLSTVIPNPNDQGLDALAINKGIVIESGKNANGTYTKFADGRLICESNRIEMTPVWKVHGTGFISQDIIWMTPHLFIAVPTIASSVVSGVPYTWISVGTTQSLNDRIEVVVSNQTNAQTALTTISLTAIGRWK